MFYPHDDDISAGSLEQRLEILMEAAERYKAAVLDVGSTVIATPEGKKRMTPKELKVAYNWQEVAKILREIRELPESNAASKANKADRLARLAEVYEVLRAAKMPKLEAVRIALTNESNQLRAGGGASTTST
jgi:hypothetical protein